MPQNNKPPEKASRSQLIIRLATDKADIRRAQALRYEVFGIEMGAKLASASLQTDMDEYDEYCDHLIVEDTEKNLVVGTYRMLPPEVAKTLPSLYSEHEFNLDNLNSIRDRIIEVGRSCVHKDYRSGSVIALLWAGLADYVAKHGAEYLAGCGSVSLTDGGSLAINLYRQLKNKYLVPKEWEVYPLQPLPENIQALPETDEDVVAPPLIKGYLRAGAYIGGEPAWDPDFNCADFFLLLPMKKVTARYNKHFVE